MRRYRLPAFLVSALVGVTSTAAQDDEAAVMAAVERKLADDLPGAIAILNSALVDHPKAASLWWLRAWCKGRAGDLDGGIEDASRAIELAPEDVRGWIERGYLRKKKGELRDAIADFDRAIELVPSSPIAWGDRGDAKKELGDLLGARADYDQAIVLRPDFGAAFHNRALALMGLGAWPAAVRDQARAIRLVPPMARMWLVLAHAQGELGRFADVATSATKALEIGDEPVHEALFWRSGANWLRGDGKAAIADLGIAVADAATPPPRLPLLHQRLGGYHLVSGDLEAARSHFDRAAESPELRPWAALMQWCATSDAEGAATELQATFAALPASSEPDLRPLLRICVGTAPVDEEVAAGMRLDVACGAWFFAGWRARRADQHEDAARCFRRCLATGRKDFVQWSLAYAVLGLAQQRKPSGHLGCGVRAVADAAAPTIEIASVEAGGPADSQGFAVGTRFVRVNDQPATEAAFAAAGTGAAVGTPVRVVLAGAETDAVRWLVAGAGAP